MPPPEAAECCVAHAHVPLVLSRPTLERIEANADVRGRQMEAAEARKRRQEADRAATAATTAAMAGTTAKLAEAARMEAERALRETQRREAAEAVRARQELRERAAEEAARQLTLAFRSRDAVKQLDAALGAVYALEQRKEQMEVQERQKKEEMEREREHQRLVQERTKLEREADIAKKREVQRRKQILRRDLLAQINEKHKKRREEKFEREAEKQKNKEEQEKSQEERQKEKENEMEKRKKLLEEEMRLISEEKIRKKDYIEREERERMVCLAYEDFKSEIKQKLDQIQKGRVRFDKSKHVGKKIIDAQKMRDAKFENRFSKTSSERVQRERQKLAEAEARWVERRRRAVEHRDHQLEAAEEWRRRQKEENERENAFDWRLQQQITNEWKRLREAERRRQQVENRRAYDKQMAEEAANRAWEDAVDAAEEADRRMRFQQEDQDVLQHAQQALEQCRLGGGPVEPIKRAIADFKKRKGLGPRPALRASVLAHLDVGLDLDRVKDHLDYYLEHSNLRELE
ncbi:golgin subfamily A member 6-like protein 22 [Cloeon dipterum]|uniref:golgin subfamily A member 6-like protein 22 n=1 Tax=Cloeon dipterum TaxID=197152 RepID=UPI00321FC37F